jgi:hypothetical protein
VVGFASAAWAEPKARVMASSEAFRTVFMNELQGLVLLRRKKSKTGAAQRATRKLIG